MAAPFLTTERFDLWQPQVGDQQGLFDLTFDEETRRFLGSFVPTEMDAFNRLLRNTGSWTLYGYGVFMVRPRGDQRIVATCGVFRSHRGFGPEKGMEDVAEAGWIVHRTTGVKASPAKSCARRWTGSTIPTATSGSPA
jgi:RimJ/RimL family protein N-acetyltransferase